MGALSGFRMLAAVLLLVPAPGFARWVQIKEDPSARITRFRMVPPTEVEGLSGERLRAKVSRYTPLIAPRPRPVSAEWLVYAECDGRLILDPQPLTDGMSQLQLSCTSRR